PSGPACVAACPTQSIVRIDPNEALAELASPAHAPLAPAFPRPTAAWPWVLGASLAALAGVFVRAPPMASGIAAGVLLVSPAAYAKELDGKIFAQLSGKNELVKTLYARVVRPYRLSRFGAIALVASGRSLRDEEKRLHARIAGLLQGRSTDKTRGIDDVVRV